MLVLINVLYVAWRYRDAALQPKELAPLLTNRSYGGSIRLLNESVRGAGSLGSRSGELACLYLRGMANEREAHLIARRLKGWMSTLVVARGLRSVLMICCSVFRPKASAW